jgi:hypothetical protein
MNPPAILNEKSIIPKESSVKKGRRKERVKMTARIHLLVASFILFFRDTCPEVAHL